MKPTESLETEIALLRQEVTYLRNEIAQIRKQLQDADNEHVSYKEFLPIRNILYGVIGLVVTTVVGAVISLVLNHE